MSRFLIAVARQCLSPCGIDDRGREGESFYDEDSTNRKMGAGVRTVSSKKKLSCYVHKGYEVFMPEGSNVGTLFASGVSTLSFLMYTSRFNCVPSIYTNTSK